MKCGNRENRMEEIKLEIGKLTAKLKSIYDSAEVQEGSFHKYDSKTRKRIDKVSWQIFYLTKELRELRGEKFML